MDDRQRYRSFNKLNSLTTHLYLSPLQYQRKVSE